MHAALVVAVTLLAVIEQARPAGFPEPPPLLTGTASIHGRVIDARSGKPIEGAEVSLADTTIETETKEIRGRTVTTRHFVRSSKTVSGNDGSYAFDGIRDGTYRLFVTHRTFLPSCRGSAFVRLQCDEITVATDQRIGDANISLTPGAIIRGRVLDKDGRPIEGASVRPEFADPSTQSANSAMTGADGQFEIRSVPPGQTLVRIDPPGGRPAWHRVMYYPGVNARDEAQPVTTEAGKVTEIEIRLRDLPSAMIRAKLSGPDGFRLQRMTLANPDTRWLRRMTVAADGAASMGDLAEGRYAIAATATVGPDTFAAYQLIIIGTGDYDVPMYLERTATVTGRIVLERGGTPPVDGVTVEANWIASGGTKLDLTGPERVSPSPDGSFSMSGLFGRRQFELFGTSGQWRVVAVRAGRSDVTRGIDLAPGSTTEITIVVSRR
jgi:protocatechuate 3,4-dioxygenase beta subunit